MKIVHINTKKKLNKIICDENYRENIDVIQINNYLLCKYYENFKKYKKESLIKVNILKNVNLKCYCNIIFKPQKIFTKITCYILDPYSCGNIKHINNITSIVNLKLDKYQNIKNIGHLIKLKKLTLNGNIKIYGIHLLRKLEQLELTRETYNNLINEINKLRKINNKFKIIFMNEIKIQVCDRIYY